MNASKASLTGSISNCLEFLEMAFPLPVFGVCRQLLVAKLVNLASLFCEVSVAVCVF